MRFEDYAREAGRALSASGRSVEVPSVTEMWTRHRRRGLALGSAAVAILAAGTVGIVAALGGLGGDDGEVANGSASPVSVPAATVPIEGGGVMFGPPRVERAETVEFPITLLDGTRLTLTLPRSLADDVHGLVPGGAASWELDPCCARSLEVTYGSVEDLYGDRQPEVEYEDADGNPVGFYTEDDALDHLVFRYGSWVVRAWDGDAAGQRFTEENREMFASLMRGHETPEGFLVLDPAEPMSIGPTDSPDATLTTSPTEPLVGVFKWRDCPTEGPSANPDLVTSAGHLVSFAESSGMTSICFPESSLYLWVSRLDLTEADLEAIDLTYATGQPDEESSTTTSTTTVPTTSSESTGVSVTEAWTASDVGIIGTNTGDLLWALRGTGDLVYVAGGNRETVTALNVQTGEEAWQQSIEGGVVGLMYADDDIIAARGYGLVHAFDPITGETLWSLDLDGLLWPIGAFRSEHGLHVLLDRPTETDVAPPQVLTVDPEDASEVWSTELGGIEHPDLDLQPHGSALVGNQLLVKTTGALHSLEIEDGTVNWMTEFGASPSPTGPLRLW